MSKPGSMMQQTDEAKARIAESQRGKPRSTEYRKAIAEGRRLAAANGGVMPHGTPGRYKSNPPCRCDECREAWRQYKRERRAAERRA